MRNKDKAGAWGKFLAVIIAATFIMTGCGQGSSQSGPKGGALRVLAVESFLADITQNVAGDHATVDVLVPLGTDPHNFDPSPKDVVRVAESQVVVINGAGLETWFTKTLENAGGQRQVIEASAGLVSRKPREGEVEQHPGEAAQVTGDPHFWLDPVLVIQYAENIRDGLILADPDGRSAYEANTAAYIKELTDLDGWIKGEVSTIPESNRLLVTNHESFGYFADRYGFKIVGTIIPSTSTEASPSAQQLAQLIDQIKATGAKAVFLEAGVNPSLADQVARETGIHLVTGLNTHSVGQSGAGSYIEMMKQNVTLIVEALK